MSLQTRLAALVAAIGADIKAIPVWQSGWGAPTNAIGKVGDYYIDMSSLNIYGPKAIRAPAKVKGLFWQLHPNPNVETDFVGWTVNANTGGGTATAERATDHPSDGLYAFHFRTQRVDVTGTSILQNTQGTNAAGNASPILPSTAYSYSVRHYCREHTGPVNNVLKIRIYYYQASGVPSVVLPDETQPAASSPPPVNGEMQELAWENRVSPSDAAFSRIRVQMTSYGTSLPFAWEGDLDSALTLAGAEIPKWGAPIGKIQGV